MCQALWKVPRTYGEYEIEMDQELVVFKGYYEELDNNFKYKNTHSQNDYSGYKHYGEQIGCGD